MSKPKQAAKEEEVSSSSSDDDESSSSSSSSGDESGTKSNVTHTASSASGTTGSGSGTTTSSSGTAATTSTGTGSTNPPVASAPLKSVNKSAVMSMSPSPPPAAKAASSQPASNVATGPTMTRVSSSGASPLQGRQSGAAATSAAPPAKAAAVEVKDVSSSSSDDDESSSEESTTTGTTAASGTTTTTGTGSGSGTTTTTTTTSSSGTDGSQQGPTPVSIIKPSSTPTQDVRVSANWKGPGGSGPTPPPRGPPVVAIVAPLPSPVKVHEDSDESVEGSSSGDDDSSESTSSEDDEDSGSNEGSSSVSVSTTSSATTANSSSNPTTTGTGGTTSTTTATTTTTGTTTTTTSGAPPPGKKHGGMRKGSSSTSSDSSRGHRKKKHEADSKPKPPSGPPPPIPLAPKVTVLAQNLPAGQQFPIQGSTQGTSTPGLTQASGAPGVSTPAVAEGATAAGSRYPDQALHDDSVTSTSDTSDTSSTITGSSSSDSPARITTAIRLVRDRRVISYGGGGGAAAGAMQLPPLPAEFVIPSFSAKDVSWVVISAIYEAQRGQQQRMLAEHPEQPVDPTPDNHLTLVNALLTFRSMGFPDDQSARLLSPFRATATVSATTVHSIALKEGTELLKKAVTKVFTEKDLQNSGELAVDKVLDAIVRIGVCDVSPCPNLSIAASIDQHRLVAKVTTFPSAAVVPSDSSVPNTPTVALLEINPQTLQIAVDAPRGEVLCNGTPICSAVADVEQLRSIVQAIQACAYVSSLISTCIFSDGSSTVDYSKLIDALLTVPPSSSAVSVGVAEQQASPSETMVNMRSVLVENMWRKLFAPMERFEALKESRLVEPFLWASTQSAKLRRQIYLPNPNTIFTDFQRRDPSWTRGPDSVCVRLFIKEVELPKDVAVPLLAPRYILLSTVADDNTVLPAMRIDAKPVKPGENPGIFEFSRKKIPTAALLSGNKTDILYLEACFEVVDPRSKVARQQCAGFATVSLGRAASGTLTLRPGTFYGRLTRADDDEPVAAGGCFCFGSKAPSRVTIEAEHVVAVSSSISETFPARFVCYARHMDLLTLFRDALCDKLRSPNSKAAHALQAVRDSMTEAAVAVLEKNAVVDQLAESWSHAKGKIPREQRDDPVLVRQHFLHFLVKARAVTEFIADLSRVRLVLSGVQMLPGELTKSSPTPVFI